MSYAIISVGGKQYRVREGERLLVDRLALDDGQTFTPHVLLVGGDGDRARAGGRDRDRKVVGQQRGPKIRIGKYKKRTGYKRHTGFRAALTQIEIESIGAEKRAAAKPKAAAAPATARRSWSRRRRRTGRELDGAQERPRLLQERPRLAEQAARGEDLRRPGGEGRHDHRAPARHQVPPGPGVGLGRDDTIFAIAKASSSSAAPATSASSRSRLAG